jgi:hypothetical protein
MSTNAVRRPRTGLLSDRFLEVFAVILLGVATVGTAWCGLQSSLWNGQQDDLTNQLQAQRVEANRLFGAASQAMAYDAGSLAEYARAVREDDAKAQRFFLTVLMRAQFVPFVLQWQKVVESGGQPPNVLEDQAYLESMRGPFEAADARVAQTSSQADAAGSTADSYLLLTVILAAALFFAGVTSSFRFPVLRVVLLSGSLACVGLAAARLVDLPIAQTTTQLLPNL